VNDDQRSPALGPHLIGSRVVVRRMLRGETGPSGSPALTDLLGVMESWGSGVTTIRVASGEVSRIAIADIVSGKPVPPRPSARHRISSEQAELRANASWPAMLTSSLGEWLLRDSDGYTARANSALAVGDPGVPFDAASALVRAFYAEHRLPAWVQVVVGSGAHRSFESAGWMPARPGEADTLFQLASVAQALRAVRGALPAVLPEVSMGTTATPAWLADDERAQSHGRTAVTVLEGPDEVGFASVLTTPDGRAVSGGRTCGVPSLPKGRDHLIAKGRVAAGGATGDWVGVTSVWVSPGHRRQGLAYVVMAALLGWAAERGATTAYLQTRGDNPAALSLYEQLGFRTHHTYRYLVAPPT